MRASRHEFRRKPFTAKLLAIILIWAVAEPVGAQAGGACALVPNDRDPSVKVLKCGEALIVRPAHGTRYRPIFKAGQELPAAIRLEDGALLIEFHPIAGSSNFQILTPLAVAAVRGTKWAMEVTRTRTSTLVLDGAVAVTNRRLNEYVVLTAGQGVDVSEGDKTMTQKQWGEARVRALLARFGEKMPIAAERISSLLTLAFVAAGLVFGGWIGLWQAEGNASALDRLESLTLDWRFLLAGPRPPPPGVVIVAIDDRTLVQIEGHAPSRQALAGLIRTLAGFHPSALAVDVAFTDSKGEEIDAELADALKAAKSVVAAIGIFGARQMGEPTGSTELALAPKPSDVLWPIDAIRNVAQVGLANVSTDASGVPRYIPMIFETPDGVAPSFALAAAAAAGLGQEPAFAPGRLELAGRSIQTDLGYNLPIRYYGPAAVFPTYSGSDVLHGKVDPEAIRGHVVVVGVTAAGFGDVFGTPFDRVAPGVEIFATAISNLLSGATLARTSSTRLLDASSAALLPAAMIAFLAMRRAAVGLALAALAPLLWAAGVFVAFAQGYWLGMAAPFAAAVPLVIAYIGARLVIERRAGRVAAGDTATLARFHSPLLIDRILREPDFLKTPVRQEVAVLFLDLSRFTRVAEALGPERSRDLLAEMQALVEREAAVQGGVVVNYMGDGVMAAFGLPTAKADDAARALLAVEGLWRSVGAWLKRLPAAAATGLDFRIGAHFGPAILSLLGAPTHQQIIVTGDTVNVASRLLEVAKEQRRRLVVTEDLVEAASVVSAPPGLDGAAYVPLTVSIRGPAAPLRVRVRD